jgi:hypothetical protein
MRCARASGKRKACEALPTMRLKRCGARAAGVLDGGAWREQHTGMESEKSAFCFFFDNTPRPFLISEVVLMRCAGRRMGTLQREKSQETQECGTTCRKAGRKTSHELTPSSLIVHSHKYTSSKPKRSECDFL